jgi:hypothetical protein
MGFRRTWWQIRGKGGTITCLKPSGWPANEMTQTQHACKNLTSLILSHPQHLHHTMPQVHNHALKNLIILHRPTAVPSHNPQFPLALAPPILDIGVKGPFTNYDGELKLPGI